MQRIEIKIGHRLNIISEISLWIFFVLGIYEPFARNYLNDLGYSIIARQLTMAILFLAIIFRITAYYFNAKQGFGFKSQKGKINFGTRLIIVVALVFFWQLILISG